MEAGKSVVDAPEKNSATEDGASANELDRGQEMIAGTKPVQIARDIQIVSSEVIRQDVVRSIVSGKVGLVTEVAGDSDSDSDDSESDDDDDDDDNYVDDRSNDDSKEEKDGEVNDDEKVDQTSKVDSSNSHHLPVDQVRITWLDGSESTNNFNDIEVLDRSYMPGDYVASASDPTGQLGFVAGINISVDLLTHNGSIIRDVNTKDVRRIRDFTIGDFVVYGHWLGRIDDVMDNVTVLFDDGSVCKVIKADPLRLKPVRKFFLEDGSFPFYPGQRVRTTSSSIFKNSRWLSGAWKSNRTEGTVTNVTMASVLIHWIASAGYGPDSAISPAEEQSPKDLKLLSCFAHVNWQLGDWCLLPSDSSVLSTCIPSEKSKVELSDCAKEELHSFQTGAKKVVNSKESNENCGSTETDAEESFDTDVENKGLAGASSSSSSFPRFTLRKVVIKRDKRARKKEDKYERAVEIVNTRTRIDVVWQDGTVGHGIDSVSLIPIETPGDHDFVAEQYVIEKAADDVDDTREYRRVGVVLGVNAKEKTAHVRWFKQVSRAEDPREFDKEEVVSVYELEGHPDYDYCVGDAVVRLSPVSISTETEREACATFSDLSWVGNITGLKNGDIEVTWADGMVSLVGPQAIFVVGRDDDESVGGGSDDSDGAASWETVEDDDTDTLEIPTENKGTPGTAGASLGDEDGLASSGRNGVTVIPNGARATPLAAAFERVWESVACIFTKREQLDPDSRTEGERDVPPQREPDAPKYLEIFGIRHSGSVSPSQYSIVEDGVPTSRKKINTSEQAHKDPSEVFDVAESLSNLNVDPNAVQQDAESLCRLKLDANAVQQDNEACSFKGFDVSKDPYDHHFLGANNQSNAGKKWLRKVQQDWNILQNNLPDGIYVRVYEDRMDLLRAVIVGAYGTPYQDGLFFFDFHLPPNYPDIPPSAYYHSGGWRINPNLYEEGKVCLSLLNTWTGRGNEVWDSSSSSILQVLVSLQGLVLNAKPYFNEAGYEKQVGTAEGEKNSLSYNENTFLLNCKSMMLLMRRPPKDFEDLIKEHFRRRGYYILKACDAYMKGYLIGSLAKDASIVTTSEANSNTIGFKIMLAKLAPKLYTSLSEIGADCQEFIHLQNP